MSVVTDVIDVADVADVADESFRSVVVSNIGKDVSASCLTEYLVNKLNISKESVSSIVLLPKGKGVDDVNYLQYKITFPSRKYNSVICSDSWPRNVVVRNFVHKSFGVQKQHFLPKKKFCETVQS